MFNIHIRSRPKDLKGVAELSCFAVNEKNKGYGTEALDYVKNHWNFIILDAHKGSANNNFYERNGFIPYGTKTVGNTECILYKYIRL